MNTFIFNSAHIVKNLSLHEWCSSNLRNVFCSMLIAFDFSFSYTPNCTISSFNFQKFSGEGLGFPFPRFFSSFALNSRALCSFNSGFVLEFTPKKSTMIRPCYMHSIYLFIYLLQFYCAVSNMFKYHLMAPIPGLPGIQDPSRLPKNGLPWMAISRGKSKCLKIPPQVMIKLFLECIRWPHSNLPVLRSNLGH